MNISTDGDWTANGLNIGLFHEDGPYVVAECLDVGFGEVLALPELRDPAVWVADCHPEGRQARREVAAARRRRRRMWGEREAEAAQELQELSFMRVGGRVSEIEGRRGEL